MSTGPKILISYQHPNMGTHIVRGPATKTNYGYYAGGGKNQFEVYEADAQARPDLFVPVAKRKEQIAAQIEALKAQLGEDGEGEVFEKNDAEPFPGLESAPIVSQEGYRDPYLVEGDLVALPEMTTEQSNVFLSTLELPQGITSRQIVALSDAGIDTVGEFMQYLAQELDMTEIPGIAEASSKKLHKMVRDYLATT